MNRRELIKSGLAVLAGLPFMGWAAKVPAIDAEEFSGVTGELVGKQIEEEPIGTHCTISVVYITPKEEWHYYYDVNGRCLGERQISGPKGKGPY